MVGTGAFIGPIAPGGPFCGAAGFAGALYGPIGPIPVNGTIGPGPGLPGPIMGGGIIPGGGIMPGGIIPCGIIPGGGIIGIPGGIIGMCG